MNTLIFLNNATVDQYLFLSVCILDSYYSIDYFR